MIKTVSTVATVSVCYYHLLFYTNLLLPVPICLNFVNLKPNKYMYNYITKMLFKLTGKTGKSRPIWSISKENHDFITRVSPLSPLSFAYELSRYWLMILSHIPPYKNKQNIWVSRVIWKLKSFISLVIHLCNYRRCI